MTGTANEESQREVEFQAFRELPPRVALTGACGRWHAGGGTSPRCC